MKKLRRRNLTILPGLILLLFITTACSIGPFDIALRQPASANSDVGLTVTAVLATNTQIASWRTATANANQTTIIVTQPPRIITATPQIPPTAMLQQLPTATSQPVLPTGDILLRSSGEALTILNIARFPVDLSGLSFHSNTGELNIAKWDNGFLSAPLSRFPAGDCLMAWSATAPQQPKPADCGTRHSWIAVNSLETFWLADSIFEVRWLGQTIATCASAGGACYVTLP